MFGQLGGRLLLLNPLAPLLEGLRLSIVHGHDLLVPLATTAANGSSFPVWSPWYLAYSAAWAVVGLVASALIFHRAEAVFAEYV
jgi:ABC-type polysaccharide/polyol phosphate export permease